MTESSWIYNRFTLNQPPYNYYPDFKLEPKHMLLNLTIDIANQTVEGSNTVTFHANTDGADKIELDAVDFDYVNVTTNGLSWDYDEEKIIISLDNPLNKDETIDIEVQYRVVDPIAGLYFSFPDDTYPNRPIYVASDHETTRARYWFPAVDHPSVRTTYEYRITSKADYTILAIGEKVSEELNDELKTVVWKHNYPCPSYISAIALGELTEYVDRSVDAGNGEIPIAYYTSSNYEAEHLKHAFDRTPEMVEWFIDKFKVPFPWAKYYQFTFERVFGAMENQTLVSWSDYALMTQEVREEFAQRVDDTNVHEMAHTYFGDMIVVKNWSHAWLKESWATYCTALYYEDKISEDDFAYDMYGNAQGYFSETSKYIRPIVNNKYHSSWEMFDRHLYPGGAWRLHMLRKMLSDEIFFRAVTDYIETFKGQTVETIDFQRKLEEHSGQSLGEFFDQWIQHPKGYPKLQLNFSFKKDKEEGTFTITQKQLRKDSDDVRNRPFKFSIDLAWFVNDELHTKRVEITQKVHEFTVSMEKPDFVTLDPYHHVLFELVSKLEDPMYRSMLENADVFTRIHAIKELSKSGKRKNIQAVVNSYENQNFWGFKAEIVKSLGKSNSRFAIDPLVKILDAERDPVLLRLFPSDITSIKDKRIEDALLRLLKRPDLRPLAKNATIRALGHQSESAYSTIESYLDDDGFKYMVRSAAFQALSSTRDEKYVEVLMDAVSYGDQPERIRRSIITSLARFGKWQKKTTKKRIVETLEDLLREEYDEVRETALNGLVILGSISSITKMKSIFGIHPYQDVVSFNKSIRKLRKSSGDKSALKALADQVEELQEKVDKLDEKLQKLD